MSRLYHKIIEFNRTYPRFCYLSMESFFSSLDIPLIPYGRKWEDLIEISKDGFSFFDRGEYAIFINEKIPATRQKFTIAHEIGHIYLGHHKALRAQALSYTSPEDAQKRWETEANIFARNILIPVDAAKRWKGRTNIEKATIFGISEEAVRLRYLYLERDINSLATISGSEFQKNKRTYVLNMNKKIPLLGGNGKF